MSRNIKNNLQKELEEFDNYVLNKTCQELASLRKPSPLISEGSWKKKTRFQIEQAQGSFRKLLIEAWKDLYKELNRRAKKDPELTKKLQESAGDKDWNKLFTEPERIVKAFSKEVPLQEDMGIPWVVLEVFYKIGREYLQSKLFEKARGVFLILAQLNPLYPQFSFSLADSLKGMEEFEGALELYKVTILLDTSDPLPYLKAAKCSALLGNKQETVALCELAMENTGNQIKELGLMSLLTSYTQM